MRKILIGKETFLEIFGSWLNSVAKKNGHKIIKYNLDGHKKNIYRLLEENSLTALFSEERYKNFFTDTEADSAEYYIYHCIKNPDASYEMKEDAAFYAYLIQHFIFVEKKIVSRTSDIFTKRVAALIHEGHVLDTLLDSEFLNSPDIKSRDEYIDALEKRGADFTDPGEEDNIPELPKEEDSKDNTPKEEESKEKNERPAPEINDSDPVYTMLSALAKTSVEQLKDNIEKEVKTFIQETWGAAPITIKIEKEKEIKKITGIFHSVFPSVVKLVSKGVPVYLKGDAGTGKSVLSEQVARALNIKFYYSGAVQQEYGIRGFTDAYGTYRESEFYKAFTTGGLFMLDEMDASSPDVLVLLNGAIANGWFDFPAPVGRVCAHEDFRVIGAGNTSLSGANEYYSGRQMLDKATVDRFLFVNLDYDKNIELLMAGGDENLALFARDLRAAVKKQGINTIVSYRAIKNFKDSADILGEEDAMLATFLKELSKSDIQSIISQMPDKAGYWEVLRKASEKFKESA